MDPYQLPIYVSNKLIIMEMIRQLAFLHEHVWHKKSTTTNLSVIVGEFQCNTYADVDTMKEELERYHFKKLNVVDHYDPEHRIHSFYMKE